MAHIRQHQADCVRFLHAPFREVHEWLDEFSPLLGAGHRKVRHHREGVQQARSIFGGEGAKAAVIHILRDCRNIPSREDYETGVADALGLRREWPVTAYIKYSEEDFEALVMNNLFGPNAVVLWGFTDEMGIGIISGISKLSPEELRGKISDLQRAVSAASALPPLPADADYRRTGLRG